MRGEALRQTRAQPAKLTRRRAQDKDRPRQTRADTNKGAAKDYTKTKERTQSRQRLIDPDKGRQKADKERTMSGQREDKEKTRSRHVADTAKTHTVAKWRTHAHTKTDQGGHMTDKPGQSLHKDPKSDQGPGADTRRQRLYMQARAAPLEAGTERHFNVHMFAIHFCLDVIFACKGKSWLGLLFH